MVVALRQYHNNLSHFFIFHSTFLLTDHKNLQQDHCSSIANTLMMVAGVTKMSANVVYIVFFGRYFHYKAIHLFNFSCTKWSEFTV